MSERIEVEGNLPEWNYTDMTIFNTQPTCGELSCDQCNERYEKAVDRIAALEAEREKLREMVMKLANEVDCTNIASLHRRKPLVDQAKALVGGEVKNG